MITTKNSAGRQGKYPCLPALFFGILLCKSQKLNVRIIDLLFDFFEIVWIHYEDALESLGGLLKCYFWRQNRLGVWSNEAVLF
ncbi:MAG: hypothetical protein EAY75_01550, partial [Bacteroidetes bacterium]